MCRVFKNKYKMTNQEVKYYGCLKASLSVYAISQGIPFIFFRGNLYSTFWVYDFFKEYFYFLYVHKLYSQPIFCLDQLSVTFSSMVVYCKDMSYPIVMGVCLISCVIFYYKLQLSPCEHLHAPSSTKTNISQDYIYNQEWKFGVVCRICVTLLGNPKLFLIGFSLEHRILSDCFPSSLENVT